MVKVGHTPCCAAYRVDPYMQQIPYIVSYVEPYSIQNWLFLSFEERPCEGERLRLCLQAGNLVENNMNY